MFADPVASVGKADSYTSEKKPLPKTSGRSGVATPQQPMVRGPANVTRRTTGPTVAVRKIVGPPTRTVSVERLAPPPVMRIPSAERLYAPRPEAAQVRPVSPAASARGPYRPVTGRSMSPVAVRVYSGASSPRVPAGPPGPPWVSPRIGFVPPTRAITPVLRAVGRRR